MNPRARLFIRSWSRVVSGGPARLMRRLAVLLGQSALVFACMLFLHAACYVVVKWLFVGVYGYTEWPHSWASWITWAGGIVLGPFAVALLAIAGGGKRWLAAVALALPAFTACCFPELRFDPCGYGYYTPRFWWPVPAASVLLTVAGAVLGMAMHRKRSKRAQSGCIAGGTRLCNRIASRFGNAWGPCGWVLFTGWLITWFTIHTGLPALVWVGLGFLLFLWWITDVIDLRVPIWEVVVAASLLATAYVVPLGVKVFLIIATWVLYWIVRLSNRRGVSTGRP